MAKAQTATVLVTSASNAAGATVRSRLDCTAVDGAIITFRITNGVVAPSAQCVARILIAHKDTSMPAAAGEGVGNLDWKQVMELGGTLIASLSTRGIFHVLPSMAYVEIEFTGNTGQAVTVEAHATTYTYS